MSKDELRRRKECISHHASNQFKGKTMFPRRIHGGGMMNKFLLMCFLFCSLINNSHGRISGLIEPPIVYAEKGTKVTIVCGVTGMSEETDHSTMLRFENTTSGSNITSDVGYTTAFNSTSLELILPKVPEQRSLITCMYGKQGVSTVEVMVGHKPEKITDLECYSDNWESLNCSFPIPKNYLPTFYEVKYFQNKKSLSYECKPTIEKNFLLCHFPSLKYRYVSEWLTFNVTASNNLGTTSNLIEFDNYKHIIPKRPKNLESIKMESNKWKIEWSTPDGKISVFSDKFDFQIKLEIIRGCKVNNNEEIIDLRGFAFSSLTHGNKVFSHTINLKYSHVWYSVKIRMKLIPSADVEKMWSEWSTPLQEQSKKRLPDFPPEINVGGFNILPNNDVYVYWRSVHECFQNGNNFSYVVKSQQGSEIKTPSESNKDFAIFRQNAQLKIEGGYVNISSMNEVGLSSSPSILRIPASYERLPPPKNIKKKIRSETKTFVLTWSPPDNSPEEIVSYTVFWCQAKSEGENKCEPRSFNFEVIDANKEHKFELVSENAENFAISANSESSTSGMYWATCTTAESKEIGKIRSVWIPRLSSTEIDIEWKLECQDTGIVAGYQIEYCLANATKDSECIGPVEKKNITDSLEVTKYTLTDLTPYKIYKIFIQLFSSSTMGPKSDALVNTTLQGVPSPVRELLARNVENTTVDLLWLPPEHFNGVLMNYKISINSVEVRWDAQNNITADKRIRYTWTGLQPYKYYEVYVCACTADCSNATQTSFTTAMGAPGPIKDQPISTSRRVNGIGTKQNMNTLEWNEPEYKGGELDFYEVEINVLMVNGMKKRIESRIKSRECIFDMMCHNDTQSLTFRVRGVNFFLSPHQSKDSPGKDAVHASIKGSEAELILCNVSDLTLEASLYEVRKYDNHSQLFRGPWSPQNSFVCLYANTADSQNFILIMFLTIASIGFVVVLMYLYQKIRDIKNIIVEFPPGLEELSIDKAVKKSKHNPMDVPDLLHNVDNNSLANEDEHKRLLRGSMNGSIGGDFSSVSDNTPSVTDQHIDEIEYQPDFDSTKQFGMHGNSIIDDKFPSFLVNPTTGVEFTPILVAPEPMHTSSPRESPKPHITMNPSDSTGTTPSSHPSSGYVSAPSPSNVQVNGNGYVTPAMFSQPIQTQPNNAYTQLNRFGKPILNEKLSGDKMSSKTPVVATTDQNGISGYVTHKQLADFGQHRMQ